jgi:transposase, IS5 family
MIKRSLFASSEREAKLNQHGDILQDLEVYVDFTSIALSVDRAAPRPERKKGGRPPFPTELMVRVLVVQQTFNLSDEQMEYQLLDRLSFQRFVGLRHSSQIPDRTTIWIFKERLIKAGALSCIFDAVQEQLNTHGYVAREGHMVDASLVPVPIQHVRKEEKALIKEQAVPADWSASKRRQKDTDATWTKKHGKSYFGFKVTANTDKSYKLIRKIKVTTASSHDTNHLDDVLDVSNTSKDLYADKGYADKARETRLKEDGYRPHIQRKAKKGKPMSECQKKRNHRIAKTRVRVEHPFAALAQMGGKLLRSIGLERAEFNLHCKTAVYNMRRLCFLKRSGVAPLRSRVAS